jgi:hypothetical protein
MSRRDVVHFRKAAGAVPPEPFADGYVIITVLDAGYRSIPSIALGGREDVPLDTEVMG